MNIPGFEIKEKISQTGAISIYRALQISLNRIVSLKILDPALASEHEINDCIREAKTAAHFKHPNSVEIFDIGKHETISYVAMEYTAGKTLRQIVESDGPMTPKRAIKMVSALSDALKAAWEQAKLVHREISPDNIIVSDEGRIKLSGFGQVRPSTPATFEALHNAGLMSGSLYFMAPEQAAGDEKNIGLKSDMYSLGATLYYAIMGKAPFHESPPIEALKKHLTEKVPHPKQVIPAVPASICQLAIKLMMKSPAKRYQDWNSVLTDVQKAGSGRVITMSSDWETDSTIAPIMKIPSASPVSASIPVSVPVPIWLKIPIWLAIVLSWILLICCLLRPQIEHKIKKTTPPAAEPAENSEE